MKLKPSLFQLIVVLMTSSLIVSCNTSPQGSQVNCNDPNFKQSQECNPSSGRSSRSSTIVAPLQGRSSGNSNSGNDTSTGGNSSSDSSNANKGSSSGVDSNSTSHSSKSGRGGFGSFSSGKAGG